MCQGACPRGHHTCLVPTALPRAPFELSMESASGVRVFWVGVDYCLYMKKIESDEDEGTALHGVRLCFCLQLAVL
jgi:hypothetical protein